MPILQIPKPRRVELPVWRGFSRGREDLDIYRSFCVDFDKVLGAVVVSEPMREIFDADDDAQFGRIEAFIRTNQLRTSGQAARDSWWIMSGSRWFTSILDIDERTNFADADISFTEESETNNPTDAQDDAVMFGNALISPSATDLDRKPANTAAWTNPWYSTLSGASALSSNAHPLDIFLNKLLIGDGNFLNTVDDSNVVEDPALTFPNEFSVNKMIHTTETEFIACNNETGNGKAIIFGWDGTSSLYNNIWDMHSQRVLSGTVVNGIPVFLNHTGQFEVFNGSGFEIIAEFPCAKEQGIFTDFNSEWVHRNGMASFEDGIIINVVGNDSYDRMPSGLWYLNLKTGNLYPRYGVTQSAALGSVFGMQSFTDVAAGAVVNAGSGSGPLACGAEVAITASTRRFGLHVVDTDVDSNADRANRGYFVTSFLSPKNATAKWLRIKSIFNEFISPDDRIIVKYKIREAPVDDFVFDPRSGNVNVELVTWTSTTQFTATLNTGRAIGDDVEVIAGTNAGLFTRITALSATPNGSALITVTVADAGSASSGTANARFDNFILLGEIDDDDIQEKLHSIIRQNSWIQFKVEMRSTNVKNNSPLLKKLLVEYNEYSK